MRAQGKPPGVLVNARAGSAAACYEDLRARLPDGHVQLTGSPLEIETAFEELHRRGVSALMLVGGDGTLSTSLTELVRVWPRPEWPTVVVSRGGTVNTIARALGARGSPVETLDQLLGGREPRQTTRALIRARAETGVERCGFIFGNGVATRWLQHYYAAPRRRALDAARLVAAVFASASVGGALAREMFQPFAAKLSVEGEVIESDRFRLIGAATIRDVGLGFRPFHTAEDHLDRFHLLSTAGGAARMALELPALRLGLSLPWSCLAHQSVRRAELQCEQPQAWMIDADLQTPARHLELGLTAPLRFWSIS